MRAGRTWEHAPIVAIGPRLRVAFETGAFGPLADPYADDAVLDWSMPGRRAHAVGSAAVVAQLGEWWRVEGVLDGSVNTRAIVLAQPPDVQQRIRDELDRLDEPHRHDGGIGVPVSVRIASGRRMARRTLSKGPTS
jgi:hypothetical protein